MCWWRALLLVLLVLLFSLAGGCAAAPAPVATPKASAAPSGADACRHEDLEAVAGQWDGATGQVLGFVVLRNRGSRPCVLFGYPVVELGDRQGRPAVRPTSRFDIARPEPVMLPPGAEPIAFVPESSLPAADGARPGQAIVRFLFGNLCAPLGSGFLTIIVTLPGETRQLVLASQLPSPPRCDAPGSPLSLAVGPFEAPSP